MNFKIGSKGAFTIWLSALASIFVIMLVYIIFNQVFYSSYGLIEVVNSTLNDTAMNLTMQVQTMNIIEVVWNNWAIIAIFGIIFWAFARSVSGKDRVYV